MVTIQAGHKHNRQEIIFSNYSTRVGRLRPSPSFADILWTDSDRCGSSGSGVGPYTSSLCNSVRAAQAFVVMAAILTAPAIALAGMHRAVPAGAVFILAGTIMSHGCL